MEHARAVSVGIPKRMNSLHYLDFAGLVIPETIVVVTALAVLGADMTLRDLEARFRFIIGGMIAGAGCAAAIVWMLIASGPVAAPGGMLVADPLTQYIKIAVLALAIFTVLISIESDFTEHTGEYLALVLLAAVGMMFLAGSEDLLMIFI